MPKWAKNDKILDFSVFEAFKGVCTPENPYELKIEVWTIALKAKRKFGHETFLIYGNKHGRYDFDQVWQIAHLVPKNYPMCTGSDIFKTVLTWLFQNGITLGIWVGKCSFYCQLTLKKNAKTAKKRADLAFSIKCWGCNLSLFSDLSTVLWRTEPIF